MANFNVSFFKNPTNCVAVLYRQTDSSGPGGELGRCIVDGGSPVQFNTGNGIFAVMDSDDGLMLSVPGEDAPRTGPTKHRKDNNPDKVTFTFAGATPTSNVFDKFANL